jgi:NADPH:quinone reductase-like Zn-dependent oxidoreductase
VLVRVRAATVHADVWHVVMGQPRVLRLMGAGLSRPAQPIPGTDAAGVVEELGAGVTGLKPGDEVFGETVVGQPWKNGGSFAELVAVPAAQLALKPANVSFEQAAAVASSGLVALRNLRCEGALKSGHSVLINGAAGNVGSVAVQLARGYGARVTAVDCAEKLELLRTLGADRVIDYGREDFTRGTERYDLVMDVASVLRFGDVQRVLTPEGKYVLIGHDHYGAAKRRLLGSITPFLRLAVRSPFTPHLPSLNPKWPPEDEPPLEVLRRFLADGTLVPVIDRTFPLSEVVAAFRHMIEGRGAGKVMLVA